MAQENRFGVSATDTVYLKILILDEQGMPKDSDALPSVYIYSSEIEDSVVDSEILLSTFTSAELGPLTAVRISEGYYEVSFVVPSGAAGGLWKDIWVATIDSVGITSIQSFLVKETFIVTTQQIDHNQIILVELDSSIGNLAGTLILGSKQYYSFTTTFNPYYASVELVRMEAGPLIEYIPDDTLALCIYWASKEVDHIRPNQICADKFDFWKTKFVVADAALRALTTPGGAYVQTINSGTSVKTLGQLSVKSGALGPNNIMSGGLDLETFKALKKLRDELWRVVNAGGCIVPGESLAFEVAVRGLYDVNRYAPGRLWEESPTHEYPFPTTNEKRHTTNNRMKRLVGVRKGYKRNVY